MLPFLVCLVALLFGSAGYAQSSERSSDDYILGPGDMIQIHVHGEEDLSVQLRLEGDGYISYPLLGDIEVAGSSVSELQAKIREGLKGDYLVDPDVRVYVLEYRMVYVNGEVTKPGGYQYVPGLTVQKAIALAGGMTDLASENKVYIIPEDGGSRRKASLSTSVQPGETVLVQEGFF